MGILAGRCSTNCRQDISAPIEPTQSEFRPSTSTASESRPLRCLPPPTDRYQNRNPSSVTSFSFRIASFRYTIRSKQLPCKGFRVVLGENCAAQVEETGWRQK